MLPLPVLVGPDGHFQVGKEPGPEEAHEDGVGRRCTGQGDQTKEQGRAAGLALDGRHGDRGFAAGLLGIDSSAEQTGQHLLEREQQRQTENRPLNGAHDQLAASSRPARALASSPTDLRKILELLAGPGQHFPPGGEGPVQHHQLTDRWMQNVPRRRAATGWTGQRSAWRTWATPRPSSRKLGRCRGGADQGRQARGPVRRLRHGTHPSSRPAPAAATPPSRMAPATANTGPAS